MTVKLLKLLFDYSQQGKVVDQNYMDKLVEIVVREEGLDNYVRRTKIVTDEIQKRNISSDRITLAVYSSLYKRISLYANNINKILECYEQYLPLFTPVEQLFFRNIMISQIILHELEHANQERMIEEDYQKESLETTILRLSDKIVRPRHIEKLLESGYPSHLITIYIKAKERHYKENYMTDPHERLAEIKSQQQILDMLELIKDITPNLVDYEGTSKIERLLRGYIEYDYDMISVPTFEYLQNPLAFEELSRFHCYQNNYDDSLKVAKKHYSLEERLTYGLSIDQKEYQYCQEVIQFSKKYNVG